MLSPDKWMDGQTLWFMYSRLWYKIERKSNNYVKRQLQTLYKLMKGGIVHIILHYEMK